METLAHPRDVRSAMPAFFALILAYVLVAAAMIGQVVQNANAAEARAHAAPTELCIQV